MKSIEHLLNQVHCADALEFMRELPDGCVDSIVTDPPAGIGFMGKEWDKDKGGRDKWIEWMREIAAEALRVIKPGGHALVWSLPRTSHWTATSWENGGWEPRDRIVHCFATGFPKSLNIQQAINKAERGCPQGSKDPDSPNHGKFKSGCSEQNVKGQGFGAGAGSFMKEQGKGRKGDDGPWSGWHTGLKPSTEDWWLLRAPLSEKNIAANVLKWGTGGINVDGCRVEGDMDCTPESYARKGLARTTGKVYGKHAGSISKLPAGRFPANLTHDGSEEVLECFPDSNGQQGYVGPKHGDRPTVNAYGDYGPRPPTPPRIDSGSASRFFFCSKPSSSERGEDNSHPTVKAVKLMQYLVKLIAPPQGICLDMFGGSGTTALACHRLGLRWILCDSNPDYCQIARDRIKLETSQLNMFHPTPAPKKEE